MLTIALLGRVRSESELSQSLDKLEHVGRNNGIAFSKYFFFSVRDGVEHLRPANSSQCMKNRSISTSNSLGKIRLEAASKMCERVLSLPVPGGQ